MSICSLGIMGTEYKRDTPIDSTEFTVTQGTSYELRVKKIIAKPPIGNTLNI